MLASGEPKAELCRAFGISRNTCYKAGSVTIKVRRSY